ncbi:ubiquinol-cytochrome c reductase iron-sulfur subunit [Sulfuricurvum sp.]|uniref:ubiquinol-cytochrome c reductase iron-sulfur subunit n=1 Tax=Sulfuricurvum sp. TaxID=2025608 RepID=UPI0025DCA570|nr:ubiquinol-cytochrome c reductase iron-sulfur subunit [Sulfuricurvum sp.]
MMMDESRRGFIGKAFGAVAAVGGIASLIAMKKTWDPLPSVMSAGFTTVDVSGLEANKLEIAVWRGKPVFILKYSADMKPTDGRSVKIGDSYFSVMIGLCTHLGCIPGYEGDKKLFKCACHGGEYSPDGVNTFGPPPRPLDIPPFKLDGVTLVLGEEGPEYKKMTAKV